MTKSTLTCSQLIGGIVIGLICFCAVISSSAQAPEQHMSVSFHKDSMRLREAIDSIEKWTGYIFQNKNCIDPKSVIFVGYRHISVPELLELWFKDSPVEYSIEGKYIGLRTRETEAGKTAVIAKLHGIVSDRTGRPIDGASVRLNNAESGPKTDINGYFSLLNVKTGAPVSISCVGRITLDTIVPGSGVLNVMLREQANSVTLVEVTGDKLKKPKRVDTTRHFPDIKDITMTTQVNMLDGLSGEIPGVILQRPTGRAAGSRTTEIRGPTSFDRNSQALYIIDGVMINPEFKGGEGTMSQYSSTLSYLPAAAIEKIVVLKSAIATALYGARGANGIVLIFTKRAAHTNKTRIMADVAYGFGGVPRREPLLNTGGYLQLRRDAWQNDGLPPTNGKAPDILIWDSLRYTDWQKVLIGNIAQYRDAIVTISGERPAVQYRISGTYSQNTTVYMREDNKYGDYKYGLHGSANIKLRDSSLLVSLTGLASVNNTSLPGTDYTAGITLPPNAPSLFSNGKINYAVNNSIVSMPEFASSVSNLFATANISYLLKKNLSFTLMTGHHWMGAQNTSIMNIARRGEEGGNLTASSTENNFRSYTFVVEPSTQLNLLYDQYKMTLNLGAVYNSMHTSNTTIDAAGFLRDQDMLNYGLAKTVVRTPFTNRYKYAGVYTHVNYAWKEKYTLELIFRVDGSSRFGRDEQVNKYGGGAIGWDFGRETFIRHALPALSYGKMQLGWSATGNDQIADYQYAGSYQPAGSYQSVEGLVAAKQQNRALTGGMTYKKDITFNLGFLENKWEIEAAYYSNSSRHQLVEYPLPDMAGGGTMQQNMPVAIRNSGIELTLNAKLVQRTHCSLAIRFNAARGANMLLSFPGLMPAPAGQTQLKRPLRELFYYDFAGVNPKNGEYVYRNRAGDMVSANELTENDRTVAVNISPRFYGGFGFTCTIYNFELSCSGQYMKRMAENAIIDKQHIPGTMWNQNVYVAGRWRRIGDNAQVQRATQASSAEADFKKYLNSTAIFMDVWYIRVNNITVAWKNGEQGKYRIYCNISNPLTFTNYRSLDPETLNRTVLPFLRTIKIGAQYLF